MGIPPDKLLDDTSLAVGLRARRRRRNVGAINRVDAINRAGAINIAQ